MPPLDDHKLSFWVDMYNKYKHDKAENASTNELITDFKYLSLIKAKQLYNLEAYWNNQYRKWEKEWDKIFTGEITT